VRAAKEVGDGAGVRVEETLFRLWNAVTAPVDLDELWELALRDAKVRTAGKRRMIKNGRSGR
jgi:hypothetical protein